MSALPEGSRLIVAVGHREIGVFNTAGRLYAIRNVCPHQGAPLCAGTLGGTMLPSPPRRYDYGRPGEILRCPWHGWEFDLATGRSLINDRHVRTYPVSVVDDVVYIDV